MSMTRGLRRRSIVSTSSNRKRPDTVKDFRRIIDRKDIDMCLICTPDHWHALPTIAACQAGKDVYVEKPLATSIDESRVMRDVAKQTGRICQMGTHWRSGEHYREAVEMVRSGKLGKVRQVRCWAYLDWIRDIGNPPDGPVPNGVDYDMWLGPAPERPFNKNRFHFNFRWFWDYAGGLMTDWGVHLINIALWAMGPEWPEERDFLWRQIRLLRTTRRRPIPRSPFTIFRPTRMIWEHQVGMRLRAGSPRARRHVQRDGRDARSLTQAAGRYLPNRRSAADIEMKRMVQTGEPVRAAHARNLLDCIKSRQQPVENLDIGHHVSTVAHARKSCFAHAQPHRMGCDCAARS